MKATTATPKFQPGVLLATPAQRKRSSGTGRHPLSSSSGICPASWGEELCQEDRLLNDQALIDGSRFSRRTSLKDGTKLWCITEAVGENGRREATTFLLPRNTERTERPTERNDRCRNVDGRGSPDHVPELLRVFRVRNKVDQRAGLREQRPLPEVLHGDRAPRFGRTLTQGPGPATPSVAKTEIEKFQRKPISLGPLPPAPWRLTGASSHCSAKLKRGRWRCNNCNSSSGHVLGGAENFCKSGLEKIAAGKTRGRERVFLYSRPSRFRRSMKTVQVSTGNIKTPHHPNHLSPLKIIDDG